MTTAKAPPLDMAGIGNVLRDLYLEADVAPPSAAHPVAPLGPIMDRMPHWLRCEEIPDLTGQKVCAGLTQRGAVEKAEQFGEATADPLAGFFYACGAYAWIFVCAGDPVVRKRFSAAHELGHYLLHFRPQMAGSAAIVEREELPGWRDAFTAAQSAAIEEGRSDPAKEAEQTFFQQEREANAFAAELLMPEEVVRDLTAQFQNKIRGKNLTGRLAESLLVSRQAMAIRLQNLGMGGAE